ncbi:alpha/beta hydrolase [Ruegeria marina]|uniref:Lysophospholipase, alpha-beta hydrolase superfamily n=1 Tax=Ruegeria marina TaxID=639004 RepID=A0A1G6SC80_9RHOB|nr:alpha/beta fold hydrolase [Ruegeria marina]SDD14502.1 Lysophospholipase, alpha-beta hydrolase superfamily [Ruegeria marina]
MRRPGRFLGRVLALLLLAGGLVWWLGPYEKVDLAAGFEPRRFGEGVQVYFESVESRFSDITPGVEKRVIWAPGGYERRTPYSVVYLHGFSATSEEIRPVPDRIAGALDANLVYTRLQGHGRGSAAMTEGTASGWMRDAAEALAAGRAVGEKVIVLSTSTGGTLAAAAALDPEMSADVVAMILVSPNFGVNDPLAFVPSLPGARYWLPLVMGGERDVSSPDPAKNTYWTSRYSWEAVVPMAALVKAVVGLDFSLAQIPALFWFSPDDKVVRPDLTRQVAARWGGPVEVRNVTMGPGDDPSSHVVAGDIMSPGQTDAAVAGMLDWLKAQGIE